MSVIKTWKLFFLICIGPYNEFIATHLFSELVKYWIHLFGVTERSIGGLYMVSLKHVSNNFNNSVLFESRIGYLGGECANPTPASQIYSQLSIDCNSSALS